MDLAHLQSWIGRSTVAHDAMAAPHARLMAATLGLPQAALVDGSALPPLWHWIYFLEGLPPAELGRDGHPARGGFLPPVPLPNRMWAGGSLQFEAPLRLGTPAQRHSRIASVKAKEGRSGALVFVTVEHRVEQDGQLAVRELHDIVYKEASPPVKTQAESGAKAGAERGAVPDDLPPSNQSAVVRPDSTQLFRYSALTFNGHRIHYDLDYCRNVEGYDNLVIHGPLIATLLAQWAERCEGKPLKRFVYRGVQAALLGQDLTLHAGETNPDGVKEVWMALASGAVSMRSQAYF